MSAKNHFGPYTYTGTDSDYEVTLNIYVPGNPNEIDIQTYLTQSEITAAEAVEKPFSATAFTLFQFFKIVENGELKTDFSPETVDLHFTYSYASWYDRSSESYWTANNRPAIYFLEKKGTGWATQWVEVPSSVFTTVDPPDDENDTGEIIIQIEELPDPHAGGTGGG